MPGDVVVRVVVVVVAEGQGQFMWIPNRKLKNYQELKLVHVPEKLANTNRVR